MSSHRSTSENKNQIIEFDFDEWHALNQKSPEEFELRRQKLCRQFIQNASGDCQRRLKGLLFQIDMQRRKSRNPLDACMRVSKMMHESLDDLRSELNHLKHNRLKTKSGITISQSHPPTVTKLKLVYSR